MICLNCCFSLCVVLEETFSIHHKTNPDLPTSRKELAEHRKSVSAEMTVSWSCGCSWTLHVVLLMLRLPFHLISCCFLTANLMMFFFVCIKPKAWESEAMHLSLYSNIRGPIRAFIFTCTGSVWLGLTRLVSPAQQGFAFPLQQGYITLPPHSALEE